MRLKVSSFFIVFIGVGLVGCATTPRQYAVPKAKVMKIKYAKQDTKQYFGIYTSKKVSFHSIYSKRDRQLVVALKNAIFTRTSRKLRHGRSAVREIRMGYSRKRDGSISSKLYFNFTKPYRYQVRNTDYGIEVMIDTSEMLAAGKKN